MQKFDWEKGFDFLKANWGKKSLIYLLTVVLIFTLSACGGGKGESSSSGDNASSSTSQNSDTAAKETNSNAAGTSGIDSSTSDYKEMLDSGVPPMSVSITKYLETKGKAFEKLDFVMENVSESDPFAAFAFMPLLAVDLAILPVTMIGALPQAGNNVWEGNLMFLYNGTGRVETKGDISTFKMDIHSEDDASDNMKIEGEYDIKTDSFKTVFYPQDGGTLIFEYTASGDGYVSQMYSQEADGSSTLIRNAFDESKLYSGLIEGNAAPGSIYQKPVKDNDWVDFVKSDSMMVVIENGKGYTIIEGTKYEY